MKHKIVICAAALVLLMSGAGSSFSQNVEWSRYIRYVDGRSFTFRVTAKELQNLPSWNPETDEVPLSSRKAVEVARINLSRFLSASERWSLDHVDVSQMTKDKWIYEVYFHCPSEDCGRRDSDWSFMIYVKMDGSIVEPLIEPYDGKGKVY